MNRIPQKEIESAARDVCTRLNSHFTSDALNRKHPPGKMYVFASMIAEELLGNHVEIGAAFGFSALFVLMLKDLLGGGGDVYSIDPFGATSGMAIGATEESFLANIAKFGYEDKVHLTVASSNPWPLENIVFRTGLIDGDHHHDMPLIDWLNLRKRVEHQILFDDVAISDVHDAVYIAMLDRGWSLSAIVNDAALFHRRRQR